MATKTKKTETKKSSKTAAEKPAKAKAGAKSTKTPAKGKQTGKGTEKSPSTDPKARIMAATGKVPKGVKLTAGGWVSHKGDDARQVANASAGELDTHQVRILRALRDDKKWNRRDLAIASGPGPSCGANWLNSLWELEEKKFITIHADDTETGHKNCWHHSTALGRKRLMIAEKVAAKVAEAG